MPFQRAQNESTSAKKFRIRPDPDRDPQHYFITFLGTWFLILTSSPLINGFHSAYNIYTKNMIFFLGGGAKAGGGIKI